MVAEITPLSVATDGFLRATFVPAGSNPKSVAVLNGATAKALTYSLTPSGLNRTITENTVEDPRMTLRTVLSRPGTQTHAVELQYVYGDTNDIARVALIEGTAGFLVLRYAVLNATDYAVGQKIDVVPMLAGKQRKDPPTANGVFTITQGIYVTGVPEDDAVTVA